MQAVKGHSPEAIVKSVQVQVTPSSSCRSVQFHEIVCPLSDLRAADRRLQPIRSPQAMVLPLPPSVQTAAQLDLSDRQTYELEGCHIVSVDLQDIGLMG